MHPVWCMGIDLGVVNYNDEWHSFLQIEHRTSPIRDENWINTKWIMLNPYLPFTKWIRIINVCQNSKSYHTKVDMNATLGTLRLVTLMRIMQISKQKRTWK